MRRTAEWLEEVAIDMRHLRYFILAAEEGSFRRAALRLDTSQSVISRAVLRIENELGADLFQRTPGHGARLTEVGRAYFIEVREMFERMRRAGMAAQNVAFGKQGRLRLAICQDITSGTLARILTRHREQWPQVYLDLFELSPPDQMRALYDGTIDLGLMPSPVNEYQVMADPVWSEEVMVALPEDHPLAAREPLSAADLDGENVILGHPRRGPRFGCIALSVLAEQQVGIKVVAEVEHIQTQLMLVQTGIGIAFVSDAFRHIRIGGIAFRCFAPSTTQIVVHAVWSAVDPPGLVGQFLRTARTAVEH